MDATGEGRLGEVEVVMVGNGAGCLHARDRHCGRDAALPLTAIPVQTRRARCRAVRGCSRGPMQCQLVEALCESLFCSQGATRKCAAEAVSLVSVCGLVLCCLDSHVKRGGGMLLQPADAAFTAAMNQ